MAGRLERAFANFRETFPLFAAAVMVAYLGGRLGYLRPMARCSMWGRARSISAPLCLRRARRGQLVWLLSLVGI
jgi:uncharacterized MAPEG superfamily protein